MRHKLKIDKWRRKIEHAIKEKDPFEIERLLNEIANNPESEDAELHHNLRMEIIKSQLCVQAYYKWRAESREYTANQAKTIFNDFLEKQKKERERWGFGLKKKMGADRKKVK